MRKLGGNTKGYLYEKTKEHPAIRYALYWDIPREYLIWAHSDMFADGHEVNRVLQRLNFSIRHLEKEISRHKFGNFVQAGKKYRLWMDAGQKRHHALPIGGSLREMLSKRSK